MNAENVVYNSAMHAHTAFLSSPAFSQ